MNDRKYRTVAIPFEDYLLLERISENEGRSLARQVSWMIRHHDINIGPEISGENSKSTSNEDNVNVQKNFLFEIEKLKKEIQSYKHNTSQVVDLNKKTNHDFISLIRELKKEIENLRNEQFQINTKFSSELINIKKDLDKDDESKINFDL